MGFRNILLWVTVLILFAGCKTSLQSNWRNFNAYYNTFYNARKSYNTGLDKNLSQPRDFNPLIPIRIHERPVNAGDQDFERAIEKSADILRKHQRSKWVDDALFLIGRSYYFQREYYSADQKFDELYLTTKDPNLIKRSIIWKMRTYLEMGLHGEGVAYISEYLNSGLSSWREHEIAELMALQGQHFVELENWTAAEEALRESVPLLKQESYKSRGYFLLGQVYEKLGRYETAYGVYDRAEDYYTEYRLQYLAQRKKAELARLMGRNDVAAGIFNEMLRDDKNLEYRAELDFELARTEHDRNNYERAEMLYNRVLHTKNTTAEPEIRARSYNGLADIYRTGYDDFMMAAVYYDSAAMVNVDPALLPDTFKASELADSFGNYSRIKQELSRQDSLLKLGLMSDEELDSVVTELRRQRILALQQERQQNRREDRLVTLGDAGTQVQAQDGRNGFLNTNNKALQESVKQRFYAIWGDRPLADNWRVQSMIGAAVADKPGIKVTEQQEETILLDVEIDLSEVPFTVQEQDEMRKRMSALQYELGNLFYLSLDMPDSASTYFLKAIENPSDDRINMVSLYSLAELYQTTGNHGQSRKYAERLLQSYPNSIYAKELRGEDPVESQKDANQLLNTYASVADNDSLQPAAKADLLKELVTSRSDQPKADVILYESLQMYLKAARTDSLYEHRLKQWQQIRGRSGNDTSSTGVLALDSLQLQTADSLLEVSALIDVPLQNVFPYQNAAFDSARSVAKLFIGMYPNSRLAGRVMAIQNEITFREFSESSLNAPESIPVRDEKIPVDEEGSYSCEEIDRELTFRRGLQEVLDVIRSSGADISSVTYKIRVNHRGIIHSLELLTEGLEETFSNELTSVIRNEVVFEPVLYQARSVSVVCNVNFSIDR